MKNILLVCAAGMSTSLLVNKMKEYAASVGKEVHIEALPVSEANTVIEKADIVMVGPQVRYQLPQVEELAKGRIPVVVIDMKDYGMVNGQAVLTKALELIGE